MVKVVHDRSYKMIPTLARSDLVLLEGGPYCNKRQETSFLPLNLCRIVLPFGDKLLEIRVELCNTANLSWFALTDGKLVDATVKYVACLLYTSPSPRDGLLSRMPSSA